ncbi:MAG: nucleoside triphosphate pyrophosphohydrolase [Schleiferiaceae bacterium]|nr:nucleoside triphosphate pyrophosphohydrolase [Schleiferiaceae bacterium]MDR9442253.1 nucleoside triphosphate pyrophosphohydrolase [Schleiferiaceae bacterium]
MAEQNKTTKPASRAEKMAAFGRLLDIMDDLRSQCPWDRKQTMESLRPLTIEETYELGDAILDADLPEVSKELGDIMLHLVFYAKIGEEKEAFDISQVLHGICEKLISRHPHIYGDVKADDEEAVKANWEKLKLKEGKKSVLEGVPRSLPALVKATRIQDKAKGAGFDWEQSDQVWDKVAEELNELRQAHEEQDAVETEKELGDVLFSLINLSRHLQVDPESALERTNKKFINRFHYLEGEVRRQEKSLSNMSLAEMDRYWEEAKRRER